MSVPSLFLLQFRQRGLYSPHCLSYVVVACGIAHAEALRVAESVASHCSHMTFLKEIEGEVGRSVYHRIATALAEETAAFWEKIESAFRYVHLQAWNILGKFHYQVAATFESLSHLLHALLRGGVGKLSCLLANVARSAGLLSLQFVAALYYPFRSGNVAYTPTCHGISLRHSVDND